MPLTNSDVHVNTPLSNVLVSYFQNPMHFAARRAFPTVNVQKQSDRYYVINRDNFNRDEAEKRAPGTEAAMIDYTLDNTPTYSCDVFAVKELVPDQIRANADAVVNLDMLATQNLAHKILIKEEKDWASTFFTGGVWSYDYDGTSTGPSASTNEVVQWDQYSTSDPITDVRNGATAILESTGFMPNTLVLGFPVFQKLLDHPDIVDRIKYGQSSGNVALADEQILAQLFGVERVIVSKAIENTADEGQTASHSFITGKKALLCYSAPAPSVTVPSAGYTFSWQGYLGGSNTGEVRKYREDKLKSDVIEAETAFDHKLVSADLGAFWDSIVA